ALFQEENIENLPFKTRRKICCIEICFLECKYDMLGQNKGLTYNEKIKLVNLLKDKMHVLISSEHNLPEDLKQYQIKIRPDLMHALMAKAELFIGESLTMASEASILGTPSVCISTIRAGTLEDQAGKGMLYRLKTRKVFLRKLRSY
ncbi:MAG: hypothetical protein HC905_25930, partial [Bacteroidales bacterium]|nr:hypothetical protein [Bacteroidales bacterium]